MVSHATHTRSTGLKWVAALPASSLLCVCHIDLGRLDNLARDRTVGLSDPERPPPRLSRIFHHPTHAQRPVELSNKKITLVRHCGAFKVLRQDKRQLILRKGTGSINSDTRAVRLTGEGGSEPYHMSKCLLLEVEKIAAQKFFILVGIGLESVGQDIVDILDKNDIAPEGQPSFPIKHRVRRDEKQEHHCYP